MSEGETLEQCLIKIEVKYTILSPNDDGKLSAGEEEES